MAKRRKNLQRRKIIGWGAAAAILSIFLVAFVYLGQDSIDAKSWPTARGRIVTSEVKIGCGRGSKQVYPHVRYTYYFEGQSYEGKNVALETDYCGASTTAKEIVATYPAGQRVEVYVDPERPWRSSLRAGDVQSETAKTLVLLSAGLVVAFARFFWLVRTAA